jgi:hypothetical protein
MVGYSGTPLASKLGIKAGHVVALVNAPASFPAALEPLPGDVALTTGRTGRGPFNVVLLFVPSRKELARRFAGLAKKLDQAGGLWVAWPKKASGVTTDLSESDVREFGLAAGLVDNKVCAVDEIWSGLRFVYRLVDRLPKSAGKRQAR